MSVQTISKAFFAVRAGEITQTPNNVATEVGRSVTLICAGKGLAWGLFSTNSVKDIGLTIGNEVEDDFKAKYNLNVDGGKFYLTIRSPVLSDGGKYECKVRTDAHSYGYAEVIVFGKTHFSRLPSVPLIIICT